MMGKIKRKRYLVNRPVQFRYMAIVGAPLILLLAAVYYLIYYAVLNEMLIPEAIAATLLPAMKKVNLVILITIPAALLIILRLALMYSNRIVGPIPRLEKELDRVIAGDYSVRLKTRNKDELSGFIGKINMLLEKVEEKI